MNKPSRPAIVIAALCSVAAAATVLLAASGLLRGAGAQVSTRPADCVCSDRSAVTGFEVRIAHCQCGALACALTELVHSGGSRSNQLQCR
jgi:hypothetical protein